MVSGFGILVTETKVKFGYLVIISGLFLGAMWVVGENDKRVKVIVCDVGQGSGIIVKKGQTEMVIDTGAANGKMAKCLGKHLLPWDKKLEIVIISHGDSDHSGGLAEVVKYYKIDQLWSGQRQGEGNEQLNYTGDLRRGDVVRMGEIEFEVIWPKEIRGVDNDDSVMGVISYRDKRVLVTGDVSKIVEDELVWRKEVNSPVEVLIVSHHGSGEATSEEWLAAIKPQLAVISVGAKNRFGHPEKKVLERLQQAGVEVKRTDIDGEVVLEL